MHSRIYCFDKNAEEPFRPDEDELFATLHGLAGADYIEPVDKIDEDIANCGDLEQLGVYDEKTHIFSPLKAKMFSVMKSYLRMFQAAAPKDVDGFLEDTWEAEMALSDRWSSWFYGEGWGLSTRQDFIRECLKYPEELKSLYLAEVYDYHS